MSAAAYRLLAAIEEFDRSFPEDFGDIKARLGEIEKQVRGEVFSQEDVQDSPGRQAAQAAATGDEERQTSQRRPFQPRTEDQPRTFGDARKAAEGRFNDAAEAAPEPAAASPSA